ncbi:DUF2231 domain-containing protein [Franconibacter pulveris]|uniref:DUF2231 domain-containing protein n=1 Tax=Franconibacter pulveris TaxID=435910 RepID=UPI00049763C6|nr:DUF2231 domain-containing protein [Franconibacter pulveris]
MERDAPPRRSALALTLYELLNPLPLGFFAAAWLFDILYMKTFQVFWTQGASWLIVFGLLIAILPRLINLVQTWWGRNGAYVRAYRLDFWLNLLAILLAILNAFIHSRDAYAVVPLGVILSTLVVLLISIANVQLALRTRA